MQKEKLRRGWRRARRSLGRRGQYPIVPAIAAITVVVISLILVGLAYLLSFGEEPVAPTVNADLNGVEAHITLMTFLRTPLDSPPGDLAKIVHNPRVADLIVYGSAELDKNEWGPLIDAERKKHLPGNTGIIIRVGGEEKANTGLRTASDGSAKTVLPSSKGNIEVELKYQKAKSLKEWVEQVKKYSEEES